MLIIDPVPQQVIQCHLPGRGIQLILLDTIARLSNDVLTKATQLNKLLRWDNTIMYKSAMKHDPYVTETQGSTGQGQWLNSPWGDFIF